MRAALLALVSACIFSALFLSAAQSPASLRGRVLSRSTEVPLRGVKLYLVAAPDSPFVMSSESKEDGSFEFRSVPDGHYVLLEEAELTGYSRSHGRFPVDASDRAVDARSGTPLHLDLHLYRGAIIQGQVMGPDKQPMAGVTVRALLTATIDGLPRTLAIGEDTTFEDGVYQVAFLRAGTYLLAADIARPSENGVETGEVSQPVLEEHLVRTFYPGTPGAELASPIQLLKSRPFQT